MYTITRTAWDQIQDDFKLLDIEGRHWVIYRAGKYERLNATPIAVEDGRND